MERGASTTRASQPLVDLAKVKREAPSPSPPPDKTFWCEQCGERIFERERARHPKHSAHLFAVGHNNPTPTSYAIPPSNVGYKLMSNVYGWDDEKGLGSRQEVTLSLHCASHAVLTLFQGRKFPIPTSLIPNRAGLGSKDIPKPRITHPDKTPPKKPPAAASATGHTSQNRRKTSQQNKRKREAASERARLKEAALRRELNDGDYTHFSL